MEPPFLAVPALEVFKKHKITIGHPLGNHSIKIKNKIIYIYIYFFKINH
jgi:hypothetical protein